MDNPKVDSKKFFTGEGASAAVVTGPFGSLMFGLILDELRSQKPKKRKPLLRETDETEREQTRENEKRLATASLQPVVG